MTDFEAAKRHLASAHEHAAAAYHGGTVGEAHHTSECLHYIRCAALSLGHDVVTFPREQPAAPTYVADTEALNAHTVGEG